MTDSSTVAAVIPTKNRAALLAETVRHLLAQTTTLGQLIIVDQSNEDGGRAVVEALVHAVPEPRRPALQYIWDPKIAGLAPARNAGFDLVTTDFVLSIDDDMVPDPDALERLLEHHRRTPGLVAVTPVITNYTPPPWTSRLLTTIFCRGPFRDDRQPVYWHWRRYQGALVPMRLLGGGMGLIRRSALDGVRLDARYRAGSLGEDIDLSWALARRGRLAIATDVHVVHARPPRPVQRYEDATLTSWGFVYAKHQPKTLANRLAFAWFVAGVGLSAAAAALLSRSLEPLRSFEAGLANLLTNYSRSSFLVPP
ncbi:MAG: glycosyltransferase family 2 protein [Candidatus Rokuibacteriota bacterium]